MGLLRAFTAANVSSTPSGGLSSATVQAALDELDTEKFDKAGGVIGTDPGGSELLRVGGAARVGGQLVVTGDVSLSNDRAIYAGGSATDDLRCYFDNANSYWRAPSGGHVWQGSAGTNKMVLSDAGNLVLGTDPGGSELLRVGGAVQATAMALRNSSYKSTFIPNTLSADRVVSVPDLGGTLVLSGASQAVSLGTTVLGTDPGGSELLRVGGTLRVSGAATFASSVSCTTLTASGKITTVSAVPASFADLAAVRTWLAAQFA